MKRLLGPLGIVLAVICSSTAAFAWENRIHPELKRASFVKELAGKTLNLNECSLEFGKETVTSHGPVGARVEGTWTLTSNGKGVALEATSEFHNPDPVTDEDVRASGDGFVFDWTGRACWDEKWSNLWKSDGLLVFTRGDRTVVLQSESKATTYSQRTLLVKVVAGSTDSAVYDRVKREAWEWMNPVSRRNLRKELELWGDESRDTLRSMVLVEGSPAKNARTTSEIWWVTKRGQERADEFLSGMYRGLGYYQLRNAKERVPIKQWTWGGPPYDIILVVGDSQ